MIKSRLNLWQQQVDGNVSELCAVSFHLIKLQSQKATALPSNGMLTVGRHQLSFEVGLRNLGVCMAKHG